MTQLVGRGHTCKYITKGVVCKVLYKRRWPVLTVTHVVKGGVDVFLQYRLGFLDSLGLDGGRSHLGFPAATWSWMSDLRVDRGGERDGTKRDKS